MKNPSLLLQRFRSSEGQQVSVDYFLYSCWEQESVLRNNGKLGRLTRYPEDLVQSDSLTERVTKLAAWYQEEYPEISAGSAVDFGRLDEVVKPTILFSLDFMLHAREIFETTADHRERNRLWQETSQVLNKDFGSTGKLIFRYLRWCLEPENKEEPAPGSRPPVGRYAPGPPGRSGNTRSGNTRSGNSRGNSGGPREGRGNRGNSRGDRDRGPRRGRGDDRGRNRRPRRDDAKMNADIEAELLKEVLGAIQKIKDDGSESITLRPQNSFRRRLQHKMISDEGFYSKSTGEGHDRAVTVTSSPAADDAEE